MILHSGQWMTNLRHISWRNSFESGLQFTLSSGSAGRIYVGH